MIPRSVMAAQLSELPWWLVAPAATAFFNDNDNILGVILQVRFGADSVYTDLTTLTLLCEVVRDHINGGK